MEKEKAIELWKAIYGNALWAKDCYGTWMYREDYGDCNKTRCMPNGNGKSYNYGWEIDHIRPKSDYANENDANFYNSYEIVWYGNNREKADNYPQFTIGNRKYKVVKCDICGKNGYRGYGIVSLDTGKRVDWKAKSNRYFKTNN